MKTRAVMDLLVVERKKPICCHEPLLRVYSGTTVRFRAVARGSEGLKNLKRSASELHGEPRGGHPYNAVVPDGHPQG